MLRLIIQNQGRKTGNKIMQFILFGKVEEYEIISIVRKSENKKYVESDEIDMSVVKRTFDSTVLSIH